MIPELKPVSFPYGNVTAGATEEEFAVALDKVAKTETLMETFAGEALEIGTGAAADAALVAGAAALGPVAVGIAVLVILPLVITSFFEGSAEELHAELQREEERHQREVQNLQAERAKAEADLAKQDSIVNLINQKSELRKKKRDEERRRHEEEEKERKKKPHSYVGCVERIECLEKKGSLLSSHQTSGGNARAPDVDRAQPAAQALHADNADVYGYEIRMSCVGQDQFAEPGLLSELQNVPDLSSALPMAGLEIVLCSCFIHTVPAQIDVGTDVSFEMDGETYEPSDGTFPLEPGQQFEDGLSMVEIYRGTVGFTRGFLAHTNVNIHGFNGKITKIAAGINPRLSGAFDRINGALEKTNNAINFGLNRLMEGSAPIAQAFSATARPPKQHLSQEMVTSRVLKANWTAAQIQKLLQSKVPDPKANIVVVADIGQGASQLVYSGGAVLFVSDFGYGRGPGDVMDRASEVFRWDLTVPVILSHWDRDHYGIAVSYLVREELELKKSDQILPWRRTWVVPQLITGILANELRRQIKFMGGTLVEFPLEPSDVKWGNITISNCSPIHLSKVDKNNNGALAFWFGSEKDGFTFYPGDANYEAIRIPAEVKGRVSVMVATHHGSIRSISPGSASVGGTIPQAAGNASTVLYTGKSMEQEVDEAIAVFSYGRGNSYNHNVNVAGPYYEKKGYKMLVATEALEQGKASDGVCYFLGNRSINVDAAELKQAQLLSDASAGKPRTETIETKELATPERGIESSAQLEENTRQFPQELTLQDRDLSKYTIKAQGKIRKYRVFATTIKIKAPLYVHCAQDFPVPVMLQCDNIEIQFSEPTHTLISFDVERGPDWDGPAEAGKEGRTGNRAFTGDYLDLRVSNNWTLKDQNDQSLFSSDAVAASKSCSVAIEYINGHGGQGQRGGRGEKGIDGQDGTDDISGDVKGKSAQKGGMGSKGAKGGAGGEPAWFPASRILATKQKVMMGSEKLAFDVKIDAFGAPGKAGSGELFVVDFDTLLVTSRLMTIMTPTIVGGQGGPGGLGGLGGVKLNTDGKVDHANSNRRQQAGPRATNGYQGKEWAGQRNVNGPALDWRDSAIETRQLLLKSEYWRNDQSKISTAIPSHSCRP